MKKVLISILVVLLIIAVYFVGFKNISIAKWKSKSVKDIKNLNEELDLDIDEAKTLNNQKFPEAIAKVEESIESLQKTKQRYETKASYIEGENVELGTVSVKKYKIERLWIALGNYAKKEGVTLQLDITSATKEGMYDLNITLFGEYIGITDFLYDIEKDDTLGFKIVGFKLTPSTETTSSSSTTTTSTSTSNTNNQSKNITDRDTGDKADISNYVSGSTSSGTSTTTTSVDVTNLKATFKIENVGIDFD